METLIVVAVVAAAVLTVGRRLWHQARQLVSSAARPAGSRCAGCSACGAAHPSTKENCR